MPGETVGIPLATGDNLTKLGRLLGPERRDGEQDDEYRGRLKTRITMMQLHDDLKYEYQRIMVDVHLHGVVYENVMVEFDPKPQYENGQMLCRIEFVGPSVQELAAQIHDDWQPNAEVFIELLGTDFDFYLQVDDVEKFETWMDNDQGRQEYRAAVRGWVTRDR